MTIQQRKQVIDDSILIPLLVKRSYHIPGNTYAQDYVMWFRNNHIVFGICLHHPKHPLETWERMLQWLASSSFGLVATSLVYEAYELFPDIMGMNLFETTYMQITVGGMVLWTAGGILHSLFDMMIWHVMACACCHPGGQYYRPDRKQCQDIGSYMLIPIILSLLMCAGYLVLLRATSSEVANDDTTNDDFYQQQEDQLENIEFDDIQGIESFSFVFKYGMELLLAWFVYFPIMGSVLFSGILGCNGKLPLLGGRPRDVELMRRQEQQPYRSL